MYPTVKRFDSSEGNVWKYVFHFKDAIAEAVLYRYNSFQERTVLCVSVQSGCQVGCNFCGTGSKFIRNLTYEEIETQVFHILLDQKLTEYMTTYPADERYKLETYAYNRLVVPIEKFQIMFMSMGEPFLNYNEVSMAICELHMVYPTAQLLVSTIMPKMPKELAKFISLSRSIDQIGLQFSIHESTDADRNALIPFKNKYTLREMRNYGIEWWRATGCRKVYCNYCIDGFNGGEMHADELMNLFPPDVFAFTFSVVCSADESMKSAGFRKLDEIREFEELFKNEGYDTRIFDPAGQDDIGGGCGQLWYVQKYLNGELTSSHE